MPAAQPSLTVSEARRAVDEASFTPGGTGRVGIECEFLVYSVADPAAAPDPLVLTDATSGLALPGGSALTLEPGGQVELSTPPLPTVGAACTAAARDLAVLEHALARHGLVPAGVGLDPLRPPRRLVHAPRYDAMETFFDADGPAGRTMMCSTASVQVNLDFGPSADVERRWRLAHAIGPVLAAAFANSAIADGRPTGMRSTRLATWWSIDPTRTAPVAPPAGRDAWAAYALQARVMLLRSDEHRYLPIRRQMSFLRWLTEGHELGLPTPDDLAYHLTTLFPPVRPRGWLELRFIDALPTPWWRVAAAVTTALLDDDDAAAEADAATADTAGMWRAAGDHALSHPLLAAAGSRCFHAALDALPRIGADPETVVATERYVDLYVDRSRCPADDQLDAWRRDGAAATARPALVAEGSAWT